MESREAVTVRCAGCGQTAREALGAAACDEDVQDWEAELEQCPDCGYQACEDCRADPTTGTCGCKYSNFGHAYADMLPPLPFYGDGRGFVYDGPFKCAAQVEAEQALFSQIYAVLRAVPGDKAPEEVAKRASYCAFCERPGATLRCPVCHCAKYCSSKCAESHKSQRVGARPEHSAECGPFLPPSAVPAVSVDQRDPIFQEAMRIYTGLPDLAWPGPAEHWVHSRFR